MYKRQVLDLEVDTGEFPTAELRELLQSLHQKKRYHRLRDGRPFINFSKLPFCSFHLFKSRIDLTVDCTNEPSILCFLRIHHIIKRSLPVSYTHLDVYKRQPNAMATAFTVLEL